MVILDIGFFEELKQTSLSFGRRAMFAFLHPVLSLERASYIYLVVKFIVTFELSYICVCIYTKYKSHTITIFILFFQGRGIPGPPVSIISCLFFL